MVVLVVVAVVLELVVVIGVVLLVVIVRIVLMVVSVVVFVVSWVAIVVVVFLSLVVTTNVRYTYTKLDQCIDRVCEYYLWSSNEIHSFVSFIFGVNTLFCGLSSR